MFALVDRIRSFQESDGFSEAPEKEEDLGTLEVKVPIGGLK